MKWQKSVKWKKTLSATSSLFLFQQKLPGDQRDVFAPDGHVPPRCVLPRPAGETTPASTLSLSVIVTVILQVQSRKWSPEPWPDLNHRGVRSECFFQKYWWIILLWCERSLSLQRHGILHSSGRIWNVNDQTSRARYGSYHHVLLPKGQLYRSTQKMLFAIIFNHTELDITIVCLLELTALLHWALKTEVAGGLCMTVNNVKIWVVKMWTSPLNNRENKSCVILVAMLPPN